MDIVTSVLANETVSPEDKIDAVVGNELFVSAMQPNTPDEYKFLAFNVTTTVTDDFVIVEKFRLATPGS